MVKADDQRMERYLEVIGPLGTAQAMMKLEALHTTTAGLAIWLDADMLVLRSLVPIATQVRHTERWQLHGSQVTRTSDR